MTRPDPQCAAERLRVSNLTVAFGPRIIQRDLSFSVRQGSIFAIMGGSGCGKSTVLRAMIGLLRPSSGSITVDGEDYWTVSEKRRAEMRRRFGVLFQSGALWSSMTVAENVALPLQMFTPLASDSIDVLVKLKLSFVGLSTAAAKMPAELSGGMRKRAALARALALDPEILFFDEPSAGLDPITSNRLDELIQELSRGLGATVVIVSHELPSLFGICDDGVFLDAESKTAIAHGSPRILRDSCVHPSVRAFMTRGQLYIEFFALAVVSWVSINCRVGSLLAVDAIVILSGERWFCRDRSISSMVRCAPWDHRRTMLINL